MPTVTKIGVIGCGGISRVHFRGWRRIPEKARVIAIADIDDGRLAWAREQIGDVACYRDAEALLENTDIDAVDICLPHHLHRSAIVAAAEAGKHILCEKPLCLDMDEAVEIERAVMSSTVTMMCAHNQLFWPSVLAAGEILDGGALGRPLFLRTLDCFRQSIVAGASRTLQGWRADPALAGGGELLDTGYHPTYRLLYLARSSPEAVSAMRGTYHLLDMRAEDSANVMVSFADGAMGNILTSWAFASPVGNPLFQVVCENGEVSGNQRQLSLRFGAFPVTVREFGFDQGDDFAAEIEHFVECIQSGRKPLSGLEQGIAALEVILAAYRSASGDVTVRLDRASALAGRAQTTG